LKIERHLHHESTQIVTNSNPGSARVSRAGDGVLVIANFSAHCPCGIAQIFIDG